MEDTHVAEQEQELGVWGTFRDEERESGLVYVD